MNIRKIVNHPSKALKIRCEEVPESSWETPEGRLELTTQAEDMLATMRAHKGLGLASNQCGYTNRVMVVGGGAIEGLVMVNPKIISRTSGTKMTSEGCLSFPGLGKIVRRSKGVVVKWRDVQTGEEKLLDTEDQLAACIQHELDHLNGKTFLDR